MGKAKNDLRFAVHPDLEAMRDALTENDYAAAPMKQARIARDKRRNEAAMAGGARAGLESHREKADALRDIQPKSGMVALSDDELEAKARSETLAGAAAESLKANRGEMSRRAKQYDRE